MKLRGHRLMPGRFPSPLCPRCGEEDESIEHGYILCIYVSESWVWLRSIIDLLDSSAVLFDEISVIRLLSSKV